MGFGIQEGLMLRNAMLDMKDRHAASQFEEQYKKHLGGIQADPDNYNPGSGYDPKALNQARFAYTHNMLQDQKVQKGVFEHQRTLIDDQHRRTLSFIKQSQAAVAIKDTDSEFKAYELAYENTWDGNDMIIGKDKKSYTITNKLTGETTTQTFKDTNAMQMSMRQMADRLGQPREFAQKALQARMENAKLNAQQEWTPLKNDEGHVAWTTKQFNNTTNEVESVYEIEGIRVPAETARTMGFMRAADKKTFAEAALKMAAAKASGKGKGTTTKRTIGTMEKDVDLYIRAYADENLTVKQATEMVRQERANSKIHEEMTDFKAELMITPGEETKEELTQIRAKREELQLKYKPVPTPKKARGLPIKTNETVPTDRLPNPKELKEGQTAGKGKYIVKNGNWTIAK